ncbi:MAG: glycosyltransferase family 9 protein [Smithellaceae bacterium]
MNILIVKLSAIGDVIHTLPSLAALRQRYPDAHITWVVEQAAADLVVRHPLIDCVIVSERKRWGKDLAAGRLRKTWHNVRAFYSQLRARNYDLAVDFHGLFKSAVVVGLSGAKRKLGYDSLQELSGLFLNEKIPEDMNKHAVDRYLDFPRHLGAKVDRVDFVLPANPQADRNATALLSRHGLLDRNFIAINPVAYWETKLWNNEKFARLADMIFERLNLPTVFTGSDVQAIEPIIAAMRTPGINLASRTSLLELAFIYRKAITVVTTDSGPMHLAAAVGTKVVALFGATDPARTGPYGPGHTVIRSTLPCSPCLLKKCDTMQCMHDITPEQVFAAVAEKVKQE